MAITTLYLGSNAYTTEDKIYLGNTLVWTASTLANFLVSEYNFNELSGNLLDQVGSNHGTVFGATQNGSEYSFDGVNDYVSIADNDNLSFSAFTFSIWVNMTDATSFTILSKIASSVTTGWEYLFTTDGLDKLALNCYNTSSSSPGGNRIKAISTAALTSDQGSWIHIAASWDGTDENGLVLYKNGSVLSSTNSKDGTFTSMSNSSNNLNIGRLQLSSNYANGSMDKLRIYNQALSGAEVTEIYNLGRS